MQKKSSASPSQSTASQTYTSTDGKRYEPHVIPAPTHPYIYHFKNTYAMPHWHENIEILYFYGEGSITCDRQSYDVSSGNLAIVNSNTLHAIPRCDGASHDCLIIDSAFLSGCDINISDVKFDVIIKDERAAELFLCAMDEIIKMRDGDEYGAAAVKAAILTLMVHLCREHAVVNTVGDVRGDTIKRAIAYIKSHYDEPLTIDSIAANVIVSKFYFCREFRRETGYTVVHYINNLRCREAQKLLRSGKYTVSEAARMCGFENYSYFTRTYKAITGYTPTESKNGSDSTNSEKSGENGGCC